MIKPSVQQQLALSLHLQDDATLASFYEGQNGTLMAALKAFLGSEPVEHYLYLWGEEGVGRTHLLQAACQARVSEGLSACYIPLQESLGHDPKVLLEGLESLSLICVDDLEMLAGHTDWEEAFFHYFNRARASGTQLLLAGASAPRHLAIQLKDLKSRLAWGLIFQVHGLNDEEKLMALQLRAKARGLVLADDVGRFLLRRWSRDMSTLYGTLAQLDQASLSAQRRLTIPFIKAVLAL